MALIKRVAFMKLLYFKTHKVYYLNYLYELVDNGIGGCQA